MHAELERERVGHSSASGLDLCKIKFSVNTCCYPKKVMHYFQNSAFNFKPEDEDLKANFKANFIWSSGRKVSFFIICKKSLWKAVEIRLGKTPSRLFLFSSVLQGKSVPLLVCSVSHQRAIDVMKTLGRKGSSNNCSAPDLFHLQQHELENRRWLYIGDYPERLEAIESQVKKDFIYIL